MMIEDLFGEAARPGPGTGKKMPRPPPWLLKEKTVYRNPKTGHIAGERDEARGFTEPEVVQAKKTFRHRGRRYRWQRDDDGQIVVAEIPADVADLDDAPLFAGDGAPSSEAL